MAENYGASQLATRFGVTRYPAIFVGDILVATPKDFGFYGKGEGDRVGRYSPWRSAASHERFRADLTRMVKEVLDGKKEALRAERTPSGAPSIRSGAAAPAPELSPARLPDFAIQALDGTELASARFAGKPLLVEFWATWCPPCRGTLAWLGDLANRYGDRLETVALAVESDEADVRKVAANLDLPLRWAMCSPELALEFGDLSAVPTLFLFDGEGRTRGIFYGAPPDLHDSVERALALLAP
ncbi:MAG: TlpA disulfide reductase family protein [Thermoanaerobaculia bacterium]